MRRWLGHISAGLSLLLLLAVGVLWVRSYPLENDEAPNQNDESMTKLQ